MLCLKKRRTYSFTQGACAALPRRSKKDNNHYEGSLNMAITTLPRNNRSSEERSRMVLTVTEDTPADMLAGSMELLVQLPRDHYLHTQRVTVLRSTPMMDLLVQIATAHKLTASNYTLQAIGEHGLVLPHHPNTPIGALDALQVKLLAKQGTCASRKVKQVNQPFETTFRLQVHLPRNQLYVSRVSPRMNLGEILDEVCREKNLDSSKYELRHPTNLEETLDLSLSLQDYQLQEVTLYAKQTRNLGQTLSTQDILALQRQEERRRQQTKQSVFGFMLKKSKESSLSMDSLGGRSVSPARSDETTRSTSPLQPPARPQRKRRPAPKPPTDVASTVRDASGDISEKDKMMINHSRNSSDSSGYHEASVLSDNPDTTARLPETLPRRSRMPGMSDTARRLAQTSQSSKSLGNLTVSGGTLTRGLSNTCLSSVGLRKKRAAPPPPVPRSISSAISTQTLERIVDSEESLTSDIDPSKSPSDIGAPSKVSSDIDCYKANSDICISTQSTCLLNHKPKSEIVMCKSNSDMQQSCTVKMNFEARSKSNPVDKLTKMDMEKIAPIEVALKVEQARIAAKRVGESAPIPRPRKINMGKVNVDEPPKAPKRKIPLLLIPSRNLNMEHSTNNLLHEHINSEQISEAHYSTSSIENTISLNGNGLVSHIERKGTHSELRNDSVFPNTNQISRCDKISKIKNIKKSKIIDDTVKQISLKSSKNHKIESDLESHFNSIEPSSVNVEKVHFESKDKIMCNDKFSQEEKIPGIVNDVDNHKSLSLNQHLNNERDTKLHSVFTELDVLATKLSLLKSDNIGKRKDNISEQDYEIKFKNIVFHDKKENLRHNLFISPNNDSLNESIIKQNCMIEAKCDQLKAHHRFISQKCRANKITSFSDIEKNIEAAKHVHPKDMISSLQKNRETCTVISTIPKCEHLDTIKENNASHNTIRCNVVENIVEPCEKRQNDQSEKSNNNAKNVKRAKVIRSQSKSDDFEIDSLKRQRRYFTLATEEIAYALNLNLSTQNSISFDTAENKQMQIAVKYCTNCTKDIDIAANHDNPSEIESLLQKVSNTLSNALPISSSPLSEPSLPLKMDSTTASVQTNNAAFLNDFVIKPELIETKSNVSCMDFPMENTLDANMPNVTAVHLQQNTLDNVSAMNDNLSINDWKYQLPAPPSAFRDSPSPVFDDYDTVMIKSVQDFKKSPITVSDQADVRNNSDMNIESKNLLNNIDENFDQKISNEKIDSVSETEINIKRIKNEPIKQTSAVSKSASSNLQKEVISELENKLENGILVQTINKDFDRRNMDNLFAPQIAPVDNTLSNFTITTYTKPKSLDIFEEFIPNNYAKNSEERFIKTFATLSRNNTGALNNYDKKTSKFKKSDANNSDCKTELKIHNQDEPSHRWKSLIATNERNNIQRSKSYISMFSNAKNQIKMQSIDEKKHESHIDSETTNMKNATSITDFNINVRTNKDNFLEWRGNALKYQEEPTKEKRLQSLQVLKSILPQLRNVPQVEKNVSEEDSNTLIKKIKYETGSNEHSTKTNVVLTCEFREFEPQCKQLLKKEDTKRYAYAGPPEINLGSWSERPSANVQLKMDIDYKLGKSDTNKTVVNINNMKNEKDVTNYMDNISENTIDKNETKSDFSVNKNREKFTRKLIAHTTASGFKIPTSSRIDMSDSKTNEIKPIMIGNELKKTFVETPKEILRNDENEVDTTPLNFKELTKAYNQYINFKQNSKRDNINRHSADYCSAQVKTIEEITDSNVKQHNHIKLPKPTSNQSDFSCKNQLSLHDIVQSSQAKHLPRFTSIVGINDTSQNFELQNKILFKGNANNTSMKIPSMPVVKGFKISTIDSNTTNNRVNHSGLSSIDGSSDDQQLSKPPTMPVITGVTLKSTTVRSKSMPIQLDSRNMLLESIRNFGGHEKLKSAAKRY